MGSKVLHVSHSSSANQYACYATRRPPGDSMLRVMGNTGYCSYLLLWLAPHTGRNLRVSVLFLFDLQKL